MTFNKCARPLNNYYNNQRGTRDRRKPENGEMFSIRAVTILDIYQCKNPVSGIFSHILQSIYEG